MIFIPTKIEGVYVIDLEVHTDIRGEFARTFCQKEFEQIGLAKMFVQMNHSYNKTKGTLRGLHFQNSPYQETKLIRCIRGSIMDVVVDIRKGSSTFLQHFSMELSDKNRKMILIPEGCAHGFQTLENNTELIYHHTAFYTPNSDGGLNYRDPRLNINWKLPITLISEKDKAYSPLNKNFTGI